MGEHTAERRTASSLFISLLVHGAQRRRHGIGTESSVTLLPCVLRNQTVCTDRSVRLYRLERKRVKMGIEALDGNILFVLDGAEGTIAKVSFLPWH